MVQCSHSVITTGKTIVADFSQLNFTIMNSKDLTADSLKREKLNSQLSSPTAASLPVTVLLFLSQTSI